MRTWISLFFQHRWLAFAFGILLLGLGTWSLQSLTIDAVPDITNIQVMINTKTGPLSPEQIERQVTFPIETEMNGIPGVEEIRSLSKYGLSQVTVIFHEGTEIYWARQLVMERLRSVDLPKAVNPELAPMMTGLGEVLMYTLNIRPESETSRLSNFDQLMRLRLVQETMIRPELRRIAGVADVDTNGGYRREIHINIFPQVLRKHGVSLLEIRELVESTGESQGGSYIEKDENQIIVGLNGEIQSATQLAEMPIKTVFGGRLIRLKDVAEVRVESNLRVGAATANGRETVLGTVLMRTGANSRAVANQAQAKLDSLPLPKDIEAKVVYSRAFLVEATMRTVLKSLLEGAALVIFVLLVFLGNLRAALLVALTIPLSMLGAFIGMRFFGLSANLMSLGALDFGLIVDGSVVLVEHYVRRFDNRPQLSRWDYFRQLTFEVARPISFGVMIIMIVYIPILFLGGIEGKMFRPMAATVLFALAASLFITFSIVPLLSSWAFSRMKPHDVPRYFQQLEFMYQRLLQLLFQNPRPAVGCCGVLGIAAILIFIFKLGSDFMPQLDEGDLVIGLVRPPAQSLAASLEYQKKSEEVIKTFSEVEAVFSRMGTPDSATDPMGVNFADTFVVLKKDKSQWQHKSKQDLFDGMARELSKVTEQDIMATQPIEMRFNEILEGSRADVTLRIYGPNLDILKQMIERAKKAVMGMPGLASAEYDSLTALTQTPTLQVVPTPERMAVASVTPSTLRELFGIAMGGLRVGTVVETLEGFQRSTPVIMHLDESLRSDIDAIQKLGVDTSHGGRIELGQIAKFDIRDRVTTIARSWGQRYSALSLFIQNRDIASFVEEAQKRVNAALELPHGYHLYWGGQFKNMTETRARLGILVPITLLLILFLLFQNFGSLRTSLVVFIAIPFSAVGGIFALWLRGMNMTVPSTIGFIALAGISVLNGIVMVTFIQELRQTQNMKLREAILQGAKTRLRPVLMTALVAALGFVPMALNSGIGAEIQRPLATVVIGGLVSSTLLTLILLPLICERVLRE